MEVVDTCAVLFVFGLWWFIIQIISLIMIMIDYALFALFICSVYIPESFERDTVL